MNALVFVAIPQAATSEATPDAAVELRLCVAVQPMLDGPTLAESGMSAWPPAALAGEALALEFAPAPDAAATSLPGRITSLPDPSLWPRQFPPTLAVRPQDGGADPREVTVQAMAEDAAKAADLYARVASHPVPAGGADRSGFAAMVDEVLAGSTIAAPPPPPPPSIAMPAATLPEFHRTAALLREHPVVMRALGLVLDVACRPEAPTALPASGVVRVLWPSAPAGLPAILSPWTRYERQGATFLPGSTSSIRSGLLALAGDGTPVRGGADPGWELTTLDVDVALERLGAGASSTTGAAALAGGHAFPALRTGGIALLRRGHEADAARRRARRGGRATAAIASMVLDADDLALGYRIDVRRGDAAFLSLCERLATYDLEGVPVGPGDAPEEGNVKGHAALDHGDGLLRTDEQFARWDGWSLAVAPPRLAGAPPAPRAAGAAGARLRWSYGVPPASAPRLRFSEKYSLRARVADLAGGGLPVGHPAGEAMIGPVVFRRFEGIAPPSVTSPVPATGPGEADLVVVVRSDRDLEPAAFLAANPSYVPAPTRLLGPPRVSLPMVERHKMLDGLSPEAAADLILDHAEATAAGDAVLFPDPAAAGVAAAHDAQPRGEVPPTRGWPDWPGRDGKRLELRPAAPGQGASVAWTDAGGVDVLTVALAPGRRLGVRLSSTMRGDFPDHFEANDKLPDGDSRDAAMNGVHPLLTPPAHLDLVHAVRRPLADPSGTVVVDRAEGRTDGRLVLDPPDLSLDAPSTASVQITARWREFDDAAEPMPMEVVVGRSSLGADATTLDEPIRQEFGDTRHRFVTYAAVAAGRHRHFFRANEDEALFQARGELPAVHVPSTARPKAPVVTAVLPAFRWIDEPVAAGSGLVLARRREALLRVVLAPPWFSSGEGERLAVIVATAVPVAADQRGRVTEVTRDALHATPTPLRWPGADALPLGSLAPAAVSVDGSPVPAAAVPHEVWHAEGFWHCDVELAGLDASYCPLVRLAVARHQQHSLAGLELSSIVQLPPVPLLPSRRLSVMRGPGLAEVRLEGLGRTGPTAAPVEAILEGCDPGFADVADLSAGPGTPPGDGLRAVWRPLEATRTFGLNETVQIAVPATSARLRLVVREREHVSASDGAEGADGSWVGRRHVFVETLDLGSAI